MKKRFIFLFLAFFVCLIIYVFKSYYSSKPVIVFVGGGSAKNFIDTLLKEKEALYSIDNYPRSFYLNLPSGSAWDVLVEEIRKYDKKINQSTAVICLSADTIKSSFTEKESTKKVFDKKMVIGLKVGEDHLVVYLRDPNNSLQLKDSNQISVKLLENLIKTEKKKLFTTRDSSGTLNAYNKILEDCVSNQNTFYDFSTNEDLKISTDTPICLFLGSRYYKPKVDSLHEIEVKTNIRKPICLYFATYEDRNGYYIISEPIRKFIKYFKDSIDDKVWEKIEKHGNWKDEAEQPQINRNPNSRIIYLNKKK